MTFQTEYFSPAFVTSYTENDCNPKKLATKILNFFYSLFSWCIWQQFSFCVVICGVMDNIF